MQLFFYSFGKALSMPIVLKISPQEGHFHSQSLFLAFLCRCSRIAPEHFGQMTGSLSHSFFMKATSSSRVLKYMDLFSSFCLFLPSPHSIFRFFKEKAGFTAAETYALKPVIVINEKLFNAGCMSTEGAYEFVGFHQTLKLTLLEPGSSCWNS